MLAMVPERVTRPVPEPPTVTLPLEAAVSVPLATPSWTETDPAPASISAKLIPVSEAAIPC